MWARFQFYEAKSRGVASGTAAGAGVTWRLLSGNNRDLGRAAAVYPDVLSCLGAVQQMRQLLAVAVAVVSRGAGSAWTWRMQADCHELAVSSRSYQRRVQTEYAFAVFVSLVPDAEVSPAVLVVHA